MSSILLFQKYFQRKYFIQILSFRIVEWVGIWESLRPYLDLGSLRLKQSPEKDCVVGIDIFSKFDNIRKVLEIRKTYHNGHPHPILRNVTSTVMY